MMRVLKVFSVLAVWTAAHLFYFWWYQQLLGLDFPLPAVALTALIALWSFSVIFFFPSRVIRIGFGTLYASALVWSLVNFAYFKVFQTFLSPTSSRTHSLNLGMLNVLKDFSGLIPLALAGAGFALFVLSWLVSRIIRNRTEYASVEVMLVPDHLVPFGYARQVQRHGIVMLVVGMSVQACFTFGILTAVGKIQDDATQQDLSSGESLSRLGPVGYAIASELAKRNVATDKVESPAVAVSTAALAPATSNVSSLMASLSLLAQHSSSRSVVSPRPAAPAVPHVLFYQLESVDAWALKQQPSPMPFLDSLMKKYGTVEQYFANGCTTVDAEFAINCGFLPETYGPVSDLYSKNSYQCLPGVLQQRGYSTSIYHANDASFWSRDSLAPAWGFDHLHFKPSFAYRAPDREALDRAVDDIRSANGPTLSYVIGMDAHAPHDQSFLDFYQKHFGVTVVPYAEDLNDTSRSMDTDPETVRNYLGFLRTTDDEIHHLFERLEAEHLLDSTIVVMYGDHRYYAPKRPDPIEEFLDYNQIPLVLYVPGMTKTSFPPIASHIDIAPTIYDILTNGTEQLPDTFLGTSVFSPEHRNVAVTKCLGRVLDWNGTTLATGDIPLNAFQTRSIDGRTVDADTAKQTKSALMNVALTSDLMLARNLLGKQSYAAHTPRPILSGAETDSDDDGLSDLREDALGTDPKRADTDGDGYSDGVEVMNGYNPLGDGKLARRTLEDAQ